MTDSELSDFRSGRMTPAELLAAARHVAECPECAAAANGPVDAATVALQQQLAATADEHPEMETELFAYVDGTLELTAREVVDEHLEVCARCRADVDDLRAVRAQHTQKASPPAAVHPVPPSQTLRGPHRRRAAVAFAAAAAIALVAFLAGRPRVAPEAPPAQPSVKAPVAVVRPDLASPLPAETPSPSPRPSYADAEWDMAVAEARTSGLAMPVVLKALRPKYDHLRSGETSPGGTAKVSPAGVVIATDRPELRWPAAAGARYAVSVYRGEELVAESRELSTARWTPPKPLVRGVTYAWQVEVRTGTDVVILPAPPEPQAFFRVAAAEELAEIARARRLHPGDHLLAGVLYARAGMQADALRELRLHAAAHPDAQPLVTAVEQW